MSFFSTQEKAFGLDISDQTLRLIQLSGHKKNLKVQLYNELGLPPGCLVNGQIKQPAVFIDHLKKLSKTRAGHGTLRKEAVVSLPESETFLKSLFIEVENPKLLPDKIKEILPQAIPVDLNEIYFDWQIINKTADSYQILVGACPQKIVNDYLKIISEAGITPVALDLEATAISNLLIDQNNDSSPQVVIDIGHNRTGLFVYDGRNIQFSISLPLSGQKTNETIAQALDLNLEQAEEAKIICGLEEKKCQGAILEVLKPAISDLSAQIKQAINFYYNNFDDAQELKKIVLCGGGANLLNIVPTLKKATGCEVLISQPFKSIKNPDTAFFTPAKSQSFITAIGLSLRGIEPQTFYEHS